MDPYQLGSNQIAKRFKIALDVLLSEKNITKVQNMVNIIIQGE